jgi:hypothetical protein
MVHVFCRYASKNVIANTYMGRLGSAAMERYSQLNKSLYNTDSLNKLAHQGTPASAGTAVTTEAEKPQEQSQTVESGDGLPATGMTHFSLVGSPNYPDIASDKGSYKANTPKHIRRRHSDSENEELNKVLGRGAGGEKAGGGGNGGNVFEDSLNNNEAKNNNDGNDASAVTNSAGTSERKDGESKSAKAGSASQAATDPTDHKAITVVRRKKTILKGDNGRKSLNRVSFDPLALLLDASLEGELELVKRTAAEVSTCCGNSLTVYSMITLLGNKSMKLTVTSEIVFGSNSIMPMCYGSMSCVSCAGCTRSI